MPDSPGSGVDLPSRLHLSSSPDLISDTHAITPTSTHTSRKINMSRIQNEDEELSLADIPMADHHPVKTENLASFAGPGTIKTEHQYESVSNSSTEWTSAHLGQILRLRSQEIHRDTQWAEIAITSSNKTRRRARRLSSLPSGITALTLATFQKTRQGHAPLLASGQEVHEQLFVLTHLLRTITSIQASSTLHLPTLTPC